MPDGSLPHKNAQIFRFLCAHLSVTIMKFGEKEVISLTSAHFSMFLSHYGNLGVFLLMTLESACIPIPSEAVLPYAGYLVHAHTLHFWPVVLVATIASVFGGIIAYVVGRYGGRPLILRYGKYILLNRSHLDKADRFFARYGEAAVVVGRLIPAVRTFISLPAGVARMKFGRFLLFSFIGSLPWNIALTYAGVQLASHWAVIDHNLKPLTYVGALLLLLAVLWFWFGRRRMSA